MMNTRMSASVYLIPIVYAKKAYATMLMNGVARRIGNRERPLSTVKRSALIKLINFPEFVSVMLFIESLMTLS